MCWWWWKSDQGRGLACWAFPHLLLFPGSPPWPLTDQLLGWTGCPCSNTSITALQLPAVSSICLMALFLSCFPLDIISKQNCTTHYKSFVVRLMLTCLSLRRVNTAVQILQLLLVSVLHMSAKMLPGESDAGPSSGIQ